MSEQIIFNPTTFHTRFEEWFSPQSYSNNYDHPIEGPAVYAIVDIQVGSELPTGWRAEIIYIGQTKNLAKRIKAHKYWVKARRELGAWLYFIPTAPGDLRYLERKLIKELNPRLNLQLRRRDYD